MEVVVRGRAIGGIGWLQLLAACLAVPLSFGCTDSGLSGARAQVEDSAGVRILTYDLSGVETPVYRIVGSPDLALGVVDGAVEYTFARIADINVTDSDALLVSDAASAQIRVFDSEGTYQGSVGRSGEGPGEFAGTPSILGSLADTLFAYDARSGRLATFTIAGELLSDVPVRSGTGNRIAELVRRSDGSYLGQSNWIASDRETTLHDFRLELDSVVIEHLTGDGKVIDTLEVMADRNRVRTVRDAGGGLLRSIQGEPPYSPRAFTRAGDGLFVIGRNDSFELRLISDSDVPIVLRVRGVEHPADAAAIRTHQEAVLDEAAGDQQMDPATRRLYLDFLPSQLPAFEAVVVGERGDVWIARTQLEHTDGYEWLVFNPIGELRGSVHTPPGMRLFAVNETYIVGVVTDELDVPSLRRYPLVAPEQE
jgi:hypothetical protein